ncbi:MAG: SDR family NAD(P)-dependent oxidoreductase [Saprospiraceae bacterium]|nr:SDR family NAD(P)-dependent oxidoreductase [Saprospiraceae bacterium]
MKKSILVTGASGNLGSAVVKKFQSENYRVLATARNAEGLEGAEVAAVDLTDEAAVNAYIQQITTGDADIQAAVLLVGAFAMGDLQETDAAALQKMYKLNFETSYFVVRALLPYFEKNGGGQFMLIGSRPGFQAKDALHSVAYGLSKSLVMYLAEIINAYGKGKGIKASVIVPSTIDTPQNRSAMPNADASKWVSAETVADSIHFLLTDTGKQLRETVLKMYNEA